MQLEFFRRCIDLNECVLMHLLKLHPRNFKKIKHTLLIFDISPFSQVKMKKDSMHNFRKALQKFKLKPLESIFLFSLHHSCYNNLEK